MNKLLGFYELKASGLVCVDWSEFTPDTVLDDNYLWTIRTAVFSGNDLNLPRAVGVTAKEAYAKGVEIYREYANNGMVIYYPFFIADKSGVIEVSNAKVVIEAVDKDLWNLVTYNKKDVTIVKSDQSKVYYGNEHFLSNQEIQTIEKEIFKIKKIFSKNLLVGKSIFLEWSFAYNTDINKKPIGEKYLVFYEAREV